MVRCTFPAAEFQIEIPWILQQTPDSSAEFYANGSGLRLRGFAAALRLAITPLSWRLVMRVPPFRGGFAFSLLPSDSQKANRRFE